MKACIRTEAALSGGNVNYKWQLDKIVWQQLTMYNNKRPFWEDSPTFFIER